MLTSQYLLSFHEESVVSSTGYAKALYVYQEFPYSTLHLTSTVTLPDSIQARHHSGKPSLKSLFG